MTTKVEALIASGAVQQSRKYRRVVILPEGQTALDLVREHAPDAYQSIMARAEADARAVCWHTWDDSNPLLEVHQLTAEEFNEWLILHGRKPEPTRPPEGGCSGCGTWTSNHAFDCPYSSRRREELSDVD